VCDLPVGESSAFGSPDGERCGRCLAQPPAFDALRSAAPYAGVAREIVKAYKYEGADFLAPHLAERMLRACGDIAEIEAVLAVPATRKEKRAHGFFPAGELARELSRLAGKPVLEKTLRKTRETARQAQLPLEDRGENVRGAFRARSVPGCVLLVDDVATSGATLGACSRELKKHGARKVIAAAFGRAIPEEN
jgi:predicted amidophosphoribosyltransferase